MDGWMEGHPILYGSAPHDVYTDARFHWPHYTDSALGGLNGWMSWVDLC